MTLSNFSQSLCLHLLPLLHHSLVVRPVRWVPPRKVHAREGQARRMNARKVHAREGHAREMHARKLHALRIGRFAGQTTRHTDRHKQTTRRADSQTHRQPETTRQLKSVRITRDKEAVLKARWNTDFLKTNLSLHLRALAR